MFYGLEQLDCFQMLMLRFQHWVFYTELFHEFVAFIYTIVITKFSFVYMCVRIALITLQNCSEYVYVTIYIFCLCSCVMKNACLGGIEHFIVIRCPYLESIYCGMERLVLFSDCPNIKFFCSFL